MVTCFGRRVDFVEPNQCKKGLSTKSSNSSNTQLNLFICEEDTRDVISSLLELCKDSRVGYSMAGIDTDSS